MYSASMQTAAHWWEKGEVAHEGLLCGIKFPRPLRVSGADSKGWVRARFQSCFAARAIVGWHLLLPTSQTP